MTDNKTAGEGKVHAAADPPCYRERTSERRSFGESFPGYRTTRSADAGCSVQGPSISEALASEFVVVG